MKVTDAVKITGSMTRTSKMPGLSYSLPAWECQTGSKLRKIKGTPCYGCYALKGQVLTLLRWQPVIGIRGQPANFKNFVHMIN